MLRMALALMMVVAACAWLVAAWNVFAVVRATPKGSRTAVMRDMHRWSFNDLARRSGSAVLIYTSRYAVAVITFIGCVVAIGVLAVAVRLQAAPSI